MIRIHTSDGKTASFDLGDEKQAVEWMRLQRDPTFTSAITALTLSHNGVQYTIPQPIGGFKPVSFQAETVAANAEKKIKGGERITCYAGDVRLTIMSHKEQRAARIALARVGKQKYNPVAG